METTTTFTETTFTANGNTFSVIKAQGRNNYISVRKETNNPFKMAGREFQSFEVAISSYKSSAMKNGLLQAQLELN